jgi:predicted AlkP superfamily pyrophosphatase or phosphodiesterase
LRKLIITAAAAALGSQATGQTPAPPKLLVVISIDQFSADLFDEYRPQFTGGLARIAGGTVFRNGYQSHAATETCPGHSTILTGDRPARTGIVMNTWVDQAAARANKEIYCAEDETVAPAAGSAETYTVSPKHLRVPTFGELLKQWSPSSRNVAVAGKDRAAVMMGGQHPDQRWYWRRRGFVTDLADAAVPISIGKVNEAMAASIARPRTALEPPPLCAAKALTYTIGKGRVVGNTAFARAAGDYSAFTDSPEFDAAVLALSAALVQEMQLGRGPSPDVLAIGLSATDYVGHTYGTQGQEMCLQLLSLDRDLGDFFNVLDESGTDYAVALTADHGGLDIPQRVPGGALVDAAIGADLLGKRIGAELHLPGPVLFGDYAGDIFVDKNLPAADRERVIARALAIYRAHPQVEMVFTRDEIARTPVPTGAPDRWSIIERARASFDPQRSGDLMVVLKPKIAPYPASRDIASTHGTPWDYDRRVPILFWRQGMPSSVRDDPAETIDIMPTLAAMLGLPLASGAVDGRCLDGIAGVVCMGSSAAGH